MLVFITSISADGTIGVVTVDESVTGSGTSALTSAVLVISPVAVELTNPFMIILINCPGATVPILRLPVHGWKVAPPSNEYSGFKITSGISSVKTTFVALDGPSLKISIVYTNSSPGTATSSSATFIIEIPACGLTGVIMVDILLLKSGSGVVEETVAVFTIYSEEFKLTVPWIKTVNEIPEFKVPILRLPFHGWKLAPPSNEYSGFIIEAGISSFNITFSAFAGPKFSTWIVYLNKVPGTAELGSAVFITKISANKFTSVSIVDALLLRFGSAVVEDTTAVFVIIPTVDGFTIPLIIITLVSPTSNVPIFKLPVHGWKVTPPSNEYSGFTIEAGTSSVKTTFSDGNGPLFTTFIVYINSSPGFTIVGSDNFVTSISADITSTGTGLESTEKSFGIPPSTGV